MAFLDRQQLEAMGFASLGEDVRISHLASIHNPAAISLGSHVRIDDFCLLSAGAGGIAIGSHVHIGAYASLIGAGRMVLADFTNLSSRVAIYSSSDDYSGATMTNPMVPDAFKQVTHGEVRLERHVIVGCGSVILPKVTLHQGSAVGALSLVNQSVPELTMVAGIPAKKVKDRLSTMFELEAKVHALNANEQPTTHPLAMAAKDPMEPIYLHLGCGDRKFDGFINIDAMPGADLQLDLTKALPWPQGSVTGIYSEHFIEHLTQAQGIRLLHECRRILKPGGVVRIATPDLAQLVADYTKKHTHPEYLRFGLDWIDNPAEQFNMAMHWWGHQWVYDEEELSRIGRMVGLKVKGRCKIGESPEPMLCNREHRALSGLILEFEKPDRRLKPGDEPLVTIAIPGYNPTYFRQALTSALAQTYTNLEILICDDCPGKDIKKLVAEYQKADPRIRYLKNPPKTAGKNYGRDNYVRCYRQARGEFIKFLNDDDILAPNCVERMVGAFGLADDITLVTSRRQPIDEQGAFLPDVGATVAPVAEDAIIEGLSLGNHILANGKNIIGEPTTVLFRKADLEDIRPDPLSMDGKPLIGVCDLAMWLHLLTKGNAIYLVETLSFFRRHRDQVQQVHGVAMHDLAQQGWAVFKYSWNRRGLMGEGSKL